MKHIVIIGNGISGITTARHVRKNSDYSVTVISAESDHFYSRTALMYIYMGHMKYAHTKPYEDWFWEKNRISLKRAFVNEVDTANKQLKLSDSSNMAYDKLVLATGSVSNKFDCPGQDAMGVQGLYSLQDLENMETHTKEINQAVIVGGGLIGVEVAEMLHSRKVPVTFLVREKEFWGSVLPVEESRMISRHLLENHIDLRLETELQEIIKDDNGHIKAIITKDGETINCGFAGITVGVSPNIKFLKTSAIALNKGVLVNEFFETNVNDVYAIGDCAEFETAINGRKKIEQIWYTGRMHGETLAAILCGTRSPYRPGIFFNSAKFFEIEYQVYGTINTKLVPGENTFLYEHPNGKKLLRINYADDDSVTGFNALGFRLRHPVCDEWIRKKEKISVVIKEISKVNFDPEFSSRYEKVLQEKFNHEHPDKAIKITKKRFFSELKF